VIDNRSGRSTYTRMSQVGAGLGAGIEDWRAVIVFNDPTTMNRFKYSGWDFGGSVSASAVTDDAGGEFSRAISVQGMTIFTFTKHGLSAKAEVKGTKFWLDDELN
jgi:lipid-binding SYLF domain-containing protein